MSLPRVCSVENCKNKYFCSSYCGVHYVHLTGRYEERLARQRQHRKKTGNINTKIYEKTPKGFLMRSYRNMQSRVTGVQKQKFHLYKGKELLERDLFYSWSLNSDTFNKLFKEWEQSGYERKLTPSVDRIDSNKGYVLGNMEWVTHSENSRRGSLSVNRRYYYESHV